MNERERFISISRLPHPAAIFIGLSAEQKSARAAKGAIVDNSENDIEIIERPTFYEV